MLPTSCLQQSLANLPNDEGMAAGGISTIQEGSVSCTPESADDNVMIVKCRVKVCKRDLCATQLMQTAPLVSAVSKALLLSVVNN